MRFLTILLLLTAFAACSEERKSPESTTAEPAAPVEATPEKPAAQKLDPEVETLLHKLADRTKCNRLTGCEPADKLQRMGRRAVPGLVALCRHSSGDPRWRERAFELVGILGGGQAETFLTDYLLKGSDRLLHSVALAAGHARMKDERARAALEKLALEGPNDVVQTAANYALARLGDEKAKGRLGAMWAPGRLGALPPAVIHVAVDAMRWLNAKDQAKSLRLMLSHQNLFVRRQALELVKDWRLKGAIPDLFVLLDDSSTGLKKRAQEVLRILTGQRHQHTREQWETWCRETPDCELPQ